MTATEPVFSGALEEAELRAWGRAIGANLPLGAVLCLSGPLGAGKSTLARAIGRGAGVVTTMPSPTFNLLFAYELPGGARLLHYDLYRLEDADDVRGLEWEDLGSGDALAIVEWPERAGALLPVERWDIALDLAPGDPRLRRLQVRRAGTPPPLVLPDA